MLRRIQGKADPVQIVVSGPSRSQLIFPNLPNVDVALTNLDIEKKPVIFTESGDYRSGGGCAGGSRSEMRTKQVPSENPAWLGSGGGGFHHSSLGHEHSWGTTLPMNSFMQLGPGEYMVEVQYHDSLTIADYDSTTGLIVCQSEPFRLTVQPRVIDVDKKTR